MKWPDLSPRELAKHVAAATRDVDMAAFYEQTLTEYISSMLRTSRNAALNDMCANSTPPVQRRTPNPSPKLRDMRDGWKKLCAERVHVGASQWKTLGECGAEDLKYCIAEREEHIERVRGQIANYEKLVRLLGEHHVAKVADLPPGVVLA